MIERERERDRRRGGEREGVGMEGGQVEKELVNER